MLMPWLAKIGVLRCLMQGAFGLRCALMRLADSLVPARLPLYELCTGLARSQIVSVFVTLSLPQAFSRGPVAAEQLAAKLGLSAPHLARFLRTAAALGLLHKRCDGRFEATRMTRALQPDAWGSMAPFAQYTASKGHVQAWSWLQHVVTTGTDAFTAEYGHSVWAWFAAHPHEENLFAQAMVALTQADAPAIAATVPFWRFACVCDVGGGHGALLTEILVRHRHLRGMLVDSATVLATAATYAPAQAVTERLTLHAGSFFEAVPAGADAYVLRHILHDWDDAQCRLILANCRRAMQVGHTLLLVESRVEAASTDPLGTMKDLTMAVLCGGQERGTPQMQHLLSCTGFRLVQIWSILASTAVWEAQAS